MFNDSHAFYNIDPHIHIIIKQNSQSIAARSLAASKSDAELLTWCNEISQRDFNEPFNPEKYSWLDGSRMGMIDFIVGSYL